LTRILNPIEIKPALSYQSPVSFVYLNEEDAVNRTRLLVVASIAVSLPLATLALKAAAPSIARVGTLAEASQMASLVPDIAPRSCRMEKC
jgi:hypothetical protein